ncbi:Uncharacterised protein [Escherichia coli]|uniref:Uncharacterized protein n=1 Tax=Escherichia coli TaxID=562 RepID=A0A376SBV5_ECOLX|nr:Uncharacterised protein [Escherichia coli]
MIQPISGPPPGQPPGQGDNLPSGAGQSAFIQSATYFAGKLNDESDLTDATAKSRNCGRVSGTILVCREIHRCFRVTFLPLSTIWRNVCWPRKKAILPASF